MSKFIGQQIKQLGARSADGTQEWLRTAEVSTLLDSLQEKISKTRDAAKAVEDYNEGTDLGIEVARLGDLLIEMEVSLEQAWVQLFGPGARIVYDYMRGSLRTAQTTRDTMSDFIASAAPGKAELVAIKRKHLR